MSTETPVRALREVRNGFQAEVHVGFSSTHGNAWLKIEARGPKVREAADALRQAIVDEADAMLKAAQADSKQRGRKAVGG